MVKGKDGKYVTTSASKASVVTIKPENKRMPAYFQPEIGKKNFNLLLDTQDENKKLIYSKG